MKINLVMFDLDGVLVDACDWHYDALNFALIDFGFDVIKKTEHESKFNGLPTKVKLDMLNIPNEISEKINKRKQDYTLDIIKKSTKIMDEKIELHSFLKKNNIKIACVTNSIKQTAIQMLKSTGQLEYMDFICSNEDVQNNKPSPDGYNFCIQKFQIDPSECLCVEDSPKGVQAAKASDAKYIWIVKNAKQVTKPNYEQYMESLK